MITGMKVEEALKIKNSDIASYLKLPPVKLHCSMLAEEAIKKAIEDVKAKSDSSQTSTKTTAWTRLIYLISFCWFNYIIFA